MVTAPPRPSWGCPPTPSAAGSAGRTALEIAVDELATAVGVDPIEFRMRNEPDRTAFGGRRFSHRSLRELYARGATEFGWHSRDPEPGSMRDGRWLVGMGVATAARDAHALTAEVTVRLRADGSVLVRCGFHDSGMGTGTAVAQVVADELSVPVDAVEIHYGDSTLPRAPGAFGSMHTASVVNGVLAGSPRAPDSAGNSRHSRTVQVPSARAVPPPSSER